MTVRRLAVRSGDESRRRVGNRDDRAAGWRLDNPGLSKGEGLSGFREGRYPRDGPNPP